jgi:phosphate acetyltransferase
VRSVYVTGFEPRSGKSVVALGLVELLSARAERVGLFRPAVAEGSGPEVEQRVVKAYRAMAEDHDVIVCEGAGIGEGTAGFDVELNARLARVLGSPVLAVVRAVSADEAASAVEAADRFLEEKGCDVFGSIVSRVPADRVPAVASALTDRGGRPPVYVIAERPELSRATVGEVATALGAEVLSGAEGLQREVADVRVAAMGVERFVADLVPGALVIVPGDRADILVACLASALSPDVPAVAGVVVTAGDDPDPAVRRLLEHAPFPVLRTTERTFAVAAGVQSVRPSFEPGQERKVAAALGAFADAVDPLELGGRLELERPATMSPAMFDYELVERAKERTQRIVLPEGDDERVLRAADILLRRGVVELTLLGDPAEITGRAGVLGLDLTGAEVVDPLASPLREGFARRYHELRKHKGVTEDAALETVGDVTYFGTMMVLEGEADGMVSGAAHTTGETIRPAFEAIKARKGVAVVSSVFFMCLPDRVLVYGDCAVNPSPDSEQLAAIAVSSAETALSFGIEPRVAMLSYSTGESGKGEDVDRVRAATELVRERRPELPVEGPIQYDAAIDPGVAEAKLPGSEVAGRATVFVFPDLETGNIAYKAVQRSAGAVAIGPVLQGLNKPVNDLSRGCEVPDIVSTVVITAIQAQEASGASTTRLRLQLPAAG